MTRRIMAIELNRSAAPLIGILVTLAGWALLNDPERWTGRWTALVLSHRNSLPLLCPLVAAAAAWLARRDRASRVEDLLDSTPRPLWSRSAPRAAVLAACVTIAYLISLAASLGKTASAAAYQPPDWYWPVLVGALSVVAAALVGLGLGRLLPYRITPPAVLVLGIAALMVPAIVGTHNGWRVALLTPGEPCCDEFSTVAARANVGQALWFSGLAAAGFVLLGARRRPWLAGVVPVAVGLAVALPVLPSADRAMPRDAGASALVCTADLPKVCVTKVYEPVLPQLVGPARSALHKLARLPNPPSAVVQDTHEYGFAAPQQPANVHVHLTVDRDGTLVTWPAGLEPTILDGAGTALCGGHDDASRNRIQAARAVAGAWIEGLAEPREDPWPTMASLIASAWVTLRSLPADEQLARVAALRQAALNCKPDLYDILTR